MPPLVARSFTLPHLIAPRSVHLCTPVHQATSVVTTDTPICLARRPRVPSPRDWLQRRQIVRPFSRVFRPPHLTGSMWSGSAELGFRPTS